ncbi:cell surface protein, partial [Bifidobacterium amazonense]|nr:cell surface protein [Bifidobacterium amazonense]
MNSFTVKADYYAGGFSGVMRNDVMDGALRNLGVDLPDLAKPQSLVENSTLDAGVTVEAGSYAGGFAGAMANSFAVNDTVNGSIGVHASGVVLANDTGTVKAGETVALAGGFTGAATLGWTTDLGTHDAADTNLLKTVNSLLTTALEGKQDVSTLLSLVGIDESVIAGVKMDGSFVVSSGDDYAGGVVGRGDGLILAASDGQHLNGFSFWKHGRTLTESRDNTVSGLKSVTAKGDYAGGIAGQLGTASIGGIVNDTVGLGGFLPFEVSALTVNGVADDGYTVTATGDYASAGIGKATGGYIGKATTAYKSKDADGNETNDVPETAAVTLNDVKSVEANNYAGGFMGASGPGDLVGSDGLNLLGLGVLKIKGLLSVAQGVMIQSEGVTVNGVKTGMTITATGEHKTGDVTQYVAGGFVGQSNSTQVVDAHVTGLYTVFADMEYGNAGGFVGLSETGGLADVADDTSIIELVKVNGLVTAVGYMVPKYTNTDVRYVNGGNVTANMAGGYAGDFQSGKVD